MYRVEHVENDIQKLALVKSRSSKTGEVMKACYLMSRSCIFYKASCILEENSKFKMVVMETNREICPP